MDKNVKLLLLGAFLFIITIVLRSMTAISSSVILALAIISLVIVVVPLYKLVFKKLRK
ncbi:hypothetical protein HX045_03005 [Myroides odoratimimus]|uniref:Uncharacterized protein n=3 Tax=Myroides TaxID=76831 RepID=A0AAJ4W3H8_MYRPR|nr:MULTISPECIES: hypothetical protein [Myroides]AJA68458.1 hypothetical protein MYRA21_1298 [Myroides sp. A21]AJH13350.1 hypothetical protein MPR_0131 [Myroides profundi]EHO10692.1 hypothetical protein HMPREF9712_01040 [Myroides odoratimimus CCUG 10230]EHO15018.1 hypothetical protein HMPREF9714_00239 [Myroides odoratimimus CCUG 12901]EHO15058.1 hypothetical protein HMPREF9715_00246 [Myroides odoratimimus CIP 101113]